MRTTMRRIGGVCLWAYFLGLMMALTGGNILWAQSGTAEPEPQPASEGVRIALGEIQQAAAQKQWEHVLGLTGKAQEQAKAANDSVGLAFALRAQAQAEENSGHPEKALETWQRCAAVWAETGNGPEQAEALGSRSLLFFQRKEPDAGKRELDTALTIAAGKRPLALATVWHNLGNRCGNTRVLADAARLLYEASLTLRRKHAPDSVDMAKSLYNLGGVAVSQSDLKAADDYFTQALAIYEKKEPDSSRVASCLNNLGVTAGMRGDLKTAQEYFIKALAIKQKLSPDSPDVAGSLNNLGNLAYRRGDLKTAQEYFIKALAIKQKLSPGSLDVAGCLNNLGNVLKDRGDLKAAEEYYTQALAIRQEQAPGSLDVAGSLNNLGNVANNRGDLKAAEEYYKQALILQRKEAPDSIETADTITNLGNVANSRGDLQAAEEYYTQGLACYKKQAPNSLFVAMSLEGLGNVAHSRGDLKAAEEYHQQALTIRRKQAPGSLAVATSLSNLGKLASLRGDLKSAEEYDKQAFTIRLKQAPDSLEVGASLNNLGSVSFDANDLKAAEEYFTKALTLYEKQAPGSLDLADILHNLGNVAISRGDRKAFEEYYTKALAIYAKLAPNSLAVADTLHNLGSVVLERGDLKAAEEYQKQSFTILQKVAPNSLSMVRSLDSLGRLCLKSNDTGHALPLFKQAADILQNQREAIASPSVRSFLYEQNNMVFIHLAYTYIQLNLPSQALEALEQGRARTLAEQRAERSQLKDSANTSDVPQELLERQKAIDNQRRIALKERERLDPDKSPEPWQQNTQRLDQLAAQQRQLEADIRRQSPHYAHLVYPTPPDFTSMQRGLEDGTLVLLYALDEKECHLFTLTRTSLHHYSLPITQENLILLAGKFHKYVSNPDDIGNNYKAPARQLYQLLIAPAQAEVNQAKRLLFCPEGALSQLPFAALLHPIETGGGKEHFLVEEKSLGMTMSLGVYLEVKEEAQKRRQQPPKGQIPLYALGAPAYPQSASKPGVKVAAGSQSSGMHHNTKNTFPEQLSASERSRFVRLGGRDLPPIPQTGALAQQLGRIYGAGSRVCVGKEATKRSVLTEASKAQVIHLGCHGLLDNGDPLASCLALTPDEKGENGFLYAYEVLGMHLPGSQVVLGACETGLGGERGQSQSEGVIGLTRAFLYAGASDVTVSLWSVNAGSTVGLLEDLHKEMRAGKGMSEALRAAQMYQIHAGEGKGDKHSALWRSPYYWAAFLNYGLIE